MSAARLFLRRVAAASTLILAACNLAPHYDAPQAPMPAAFKEAVSGGEADQGWKIADPRDAATRGAWWEAYGDPELDALEARVAISNQTVVAAEANYRAARALVREAQAQWYPTLALAPSATREKSSAALAQIGGGVAASPAVGTTTGGAGATTTTTAGGGSSALTHDVFALPLEASYEVDLWGSIRNQVAESRFNAQASAAQLATALLSTQSTLAQDYFQLRVADEQRRVLEATVADYEATLKLVRTLYDNGVDSDEDIAEAETQLDSAMAQATDLGISRAQYEHAIAVLIGVPPAQFSIPYKRLRPQLPTIPVGVPSDLLERRPDIATAERQVAASNAQIGVARAAYFPSVTLSGSAGFESTLWRQLLDWPNRFWSVGPSLSQVLFDGGARRAATAQARALNDSQVASYRQTVLTALQSVEDNLVSLRILAKELIQQHKATVAAQHAVELSVVRFRNGVDSYVNVITAQNAFLANREAELQIVLKRLTASVNLINNLGGGWERSGWRETERMAQHPPSGEGQPKIPAEDATPGVANPPPVPEREILPDEIVKHNEDSMAPGEH